MAIVNLSRSGTVSVIEEFTAKAGLQQQPEQGLRAILFINQALISNVETGKQLCITDGGSRIDLADVYEAHMERVQEQCDPQDDREVHGVDDLAVDNIRTYLKSQFIAVKSNEDVVAVAASVAMAFYNQFGTGQDGALHIPVFSPLAPLAPQKAHIYLKL